jgi:hypothetical protein
MSSLTLTVGATIGLSYFGFRQGLLRLRPEPRRCPTCGQRLRSRTCSSCARRGA